MIVKICGITRMDDMLAAVDAGAGMLGFNFYPPSPRYIERTTCIELVRALRARRPEVTAVGVFVNMPPPAILTILDECGLDLAQLSGDEPPADLTLFGARAFKAIRPRDAGEALDLAARYAGPRYAGRSALPAYLVDASAGAGHFGGAGQTGDWEAARVLAARCAILLAGGLRPDNVAAAVAAVHPWGVDVASGVESSPGRKDMKKMRQFVSNARLADQRASE